LYAEASELHLSPGSPTVFGLLLPGWPLAQRIILDVLETMLDVPDWSDVEMVVMDKACGCRERHRDSRPGLSLG